MRNTGVGIEGFVNTYGCLLFRETVKLTTKLIAKIMTYNF